MSKPEWTARLLLGGLSALLFAGAYALVDSSIATGDVYPDFSSLRADPNGTRILYESLSRLPGFETTRAFKPVKPALEHNAVILEIGVGMGSLSGQDPEHREWQRLAEAGNRIVVATHVPTWADPTDAVKVLDSTATFSDKDRVVHFKAGPDWTVISPTAIERKFGSGSIVLMGSSDAFLNRTLAGKHDSVLLLRTIGNYRRVIFEEAHLGVRDSGSVLGLARRYHLTGLLLGLLLLALVFVWSQGAQFPPRAASAGASIVGHDFQSGFLQLLRKHVPRSALVATCVAEWRRSHPKALVPQVSNKLDVLAAYAAIQKDLAHK